MRQLKKKIFALMGACIIMSGITAYAEDFYNPVYSDPFNNDLFEIVSEVKFSDEIKKECPDIMGGGTADAGFTVFRYSIVPNPENEQGYGMKYTNIKIDYDGNAYITSREKLNNNGTGEITEPQDGIVKDGLGEYHVVIENEVDPNYNDMRSEFKDINGNLIASLSNWYAVIKYTCGVINVVRDMNSGTLSGDEITYILNPWEANKEYYFKGAIYEFDDNGYAIYNPNNLQECTTDDKYYVIKLKRGIIPSVSYNGEKITFDQIPVIENGVFKGLYGTSAIKNSDLMFDSGYITFCDYDSDGKADALICEKFETVVLEHVSVPNMILYGKYADKRIELDSDNTETDFNITKDGKETDISALTENNVLCVARADYNGGTLYNITVSDKKAKGTLESMTTDSKGKAYVTVNGASYRLSEDYYKNGTYAKNAEEIELGAEVTAYLNINGQVAYVEKAMEKEQKGYLTAVKPADKNFDSALLLKIFTPSGSFIYPVTAQKLYINGIKSNDPENDLSFSDTSGAKRCNQYIKYKLNTDGEVTEIKTQYGGFLCDIKSTVSHIHPPAAMVNHLYKINSDTVLFSIPENTENDDEYKALSIDDTVNRDYKLSVYDADSEYNAGAVIIENYDSVMSEYIKSLSSVESRMFLVESISEVYEDSGETVKLIRGLRNGEIQSYKLKSKLDGSGIKPGDAIRIITDSDSYINTVYREFSRKDNTLFVGNNTISGYREKANGAAYGPEQLYLYGIADKTQKGKNIFSQVGDSLRRLEYSSGKTKVYLFDEEEKTAKNVSFDDIEEGDVIYAHVHRSIVYEIVIYR